jgi:hypothetical protein
MLTRKPNGDVDISVRAPLIYCDHWALRQISSSATRRKHLLETFRTRGTLMFSIFNIVEMAQNTGESYSRLRDLLDGIGQHWLFTESDPRTVQVRMAGGMPPPAAFLGSIPLLAGIYGSLPEGTYKLGSALESLHDEKFRDRAKSMLTRPNMVRMLEYNRARHKRGERMIPNPQPKGSPMWIELELIRYFIKDGKKIMNNDVIDIMHAVVPLFFAPIVLLEKAWASFAEKLKLPDVHVFAAPKLDEALEAIRNIDISRYRVYRPDPPLIIDALRPGQ